MTMYLKNTACPKGLKPQALLMIIIAEQVHAELGFHMCITSLNDSNHAVDSYHYSGNAFDSRIRQGAYINDTRYPTAAEAEKIIEIAKGRLGPAFDVIFEKDHIHWEYNARTYGDL